MESVTKQPLSSSCLRIVTSPLDDHLLLQNPLCTDYDNDNTFIFDKS